ncbi:MAG: hypothetical protein ACOYJV_08750 [Aminivibrio sp.]|jgi:peroxiredoxin
MKEGDMFPAFSLSDGGGREWSGEDFAGRRFVMFFYSKNNTSG